ncbi:PREDICTED: nuclear hormone receptor HR96 [Ceratosolen solmsi marchali]|uniref:Nuclear hormone receptor HR96 n=1 Tax=Ceratosolen solmsi marchali TaxID=326594 RepID=A0AAJ6YJF9_9HYME|nr:PREDICTED: nuclear hormone receptor HR96 [Ceratosolen solmsi marchali]
MEDEHAVREANKICGVCGDRALGYNFNAVSCESCKAFFRRNALKNKDFRCPFSENCNITPVTRRFCQKCRLDKCFRIGMRKEYIMSEEDKVLKRQKIEQNRAKKRPSSESQKTMKMKRESIDDSNFDETCTSIPSVTSVISESYFWESDKKYTNLDANKQPSMDSMSPVTAASVPSPSSPSENCDIVGTKTLEMLKDSSHSSLTNFVKFDHSISYNPNDLNIEKSSASRINFDTNSINNYAQEKEHLLDSVKIIESIGTCKKLEKHFQEPMDSSVSSPKRLRLQNNLPNYSILKPSLEEQKLYIPYAECSTNVNLMETCMHQVVPESNAEDTIVCQKSKEPSLKGSELALKMMQNPELIAKIVNSPNIIAKVIEDQNLLTKFISNPEIINKLVSDPQISKFLEEKILSPNMHETAKRNTDKNAIDKLISNGISDNMIRNMLDNDQNHVENPILTNLITNRNTEEHNYQNHDSTINEWSKTTDDVTRDVLQDVQRIPIAANSIESILCEAIKLEFSAYSTLGGNQNSRELNDAERAKLNELIVANKALLAPLDDDITNLVGEECRFKGNSGQSDPMLLDVINLTAIAIRRLIKMSKKINAFKNMCQEDQLALLKGGCTEMMILRSAINYDPDRDIWKIPHSQDRMSKIKVDVLKEAKGNLYTEHSRFVRTFDPRWRDENIILILSAIALFSPDRPRVIHGDVIKLEQNSYYYLLRRYLESIYPGCEAKSTFLKLIQKISELHRLNDEVVGVYLNVNPSSVEPLLIEIFDLKH